MIVNKWIYWTTENPGKWQCIRDDLFDQLEVIEKGAMFFTWTSLSELYEGNDKPEPNRFGDFPLDFDHKEMPENALQDLKTLCLIHLPELFGIDPYGIEFYASGSKGFHAVIPSRFFDAQDGDPYLPLIYKRLAAEWKEKLNLQTLDLSMYCMGKGKMFRHPNVKRSNGKYKVPLSLEEVRDLPIENLLKLTMAPREIDEVEADISESEELGNIYRNTKAIIHTELKDQPEPVKLTEDERKRLAEKLPPCITHILTAMPPKSDVVNFNRLTMLLVTYFQMAAWAKKDVWDKVQTFLEGYPHSESYDTPGKRISHWKAEWNYLQGNSAYSFNCSFVKGFKLPGNTFDCKKCSIGANKVKTIYDESICTWIEYVDLDIPPKKSILHPWVKEQSIILVWGWRGIGKSWFAMSLCHAISTGLPFGPWKVTEPVKCLYIDAEMAASDPQERFNLFDLSNENAMILSCAWASQTDQPSFDLIDIAKKEHLKQFMIREKIKVVVFDNLGTMTPGEDENKKETWDMVNPWLLDLRFNGITSIIIHHEGKGGDQRGHSAHEDNIDFSIRLQKPHDYRVEDGARFNVLFTKQRIPTEELPLIKTVELKLDNVRGRKFDEAWTFKDIDLGNKEKILKMLDEGLTQKEIASELGIDKAYVSRVRRQAINDGVLTKKNKLTDSELD